MRRIILVLGIVTLMSCQKEATEPTQEPLDCTCGIIDDKDFVGGSFYELVIDNHCTGNKKIIVRHEQTANQYAIGDEWCTNDGTTW
jgi:hypothetical protein